MSGHKNLNHNNICLYSCAKCFKNVRPNQNYKSCDNCELYFHVSCIDFNSSNNTWWCYKCFTRTCLNELPYSDTYIDHDFYLGKGLKFAHLNIQCLRNKSDQVKLFLHANNIDLFCLTETWLNDEFSDSDIHVNGYNLCRIDRKEINHGGILCYIKDGIQYKNVSKYDDDVIEALWVEINLPQTQSLF